MLAEPIVRSEVSSYRPRIGTLVTPVDAYWVQALEAVLHANQQFGDEIINLQPAATLADLFSTPTNDLIDQILAHDLDVLITTPVSSLIETLVDEGLPVISMSDIDFSHPLFTTFGSLYEGGRIAGRFIAERLGGRGHVVCVTAGLEKINQSGQNRYAGLRDELKDYAAISIGQIQSYWTYAPAYASLLDLLAAYPRRIDAIFGVSDSVILAVRDAATRLGLIRDDLVLVGLNGDPLALAGIDAGTLTATVDISSDALGARTMALAHDIALGRKVPSIIPQTFHLITRDNVASIATRKLVAMADLPTRMVGYSRQQEDDRRNQLETSVGITHRITSLFDSEKLIQMISELALDSYGYDWVRILRWSESEQKLCLYGGTLSPASLQVPLACDWLVQQVFQDHEVVFIPDTQNSHRGRSGAEWRSVRARAVLPIQLGATVIGVLDLQSSHPMRQQSLEMVGLKLLASQIGIAMQNVDLYLDASRSREAAEKANQLKTRLVANVGHEMRTPLNAILGFSQSIRNKLAAGEIIAPQVLLQDIQYIYSGGEHLMNMINDLLDLSRAEIGALSLYFEPLQPVSFLSDLFTEFSHSQAATPGLNWVLEMPDQLPLVRADVVRLRQVLINLLSNAGKYTRRGAITLGAEVVLPYLHLWVRDTGPGVPFELQAKIFEPFGIVGRKRRQEGIGLGLSITRHLVSLHDGIITLESQPDHGSTFHIYLPLPGVAREPEHPQLMPVTQLSAATKPTVGPTSRLMLVASNGAPVPGQIEQICVRHGLTARLIQKHDDLIHILAEGKPAAIAWDLSSASATEWNVVFRLSSNSDCAALPVILYGIPQGAPDASNAPAPAGAGLTHIVFKTCNMNTLKDWMSEVDIDEAVQGPVLVVDDDPQARAYYQKLLAESYPGRRVILAENGRQALDILKVEVPVLIVLDLMMPEVDGFKVLECVRADGRTQRVPVVIISGKLLNYEDITRLNYLKTTFYTKGVFTDQEMVSLISECDGEKRTLPQPTSLLIKQALSYLHQNYDQPINRCNLAESVGVSENYLSQIFRQEMTISLWDYLNRLRIQKSKELLMRSEDSVTSIATRVGFNDSAYFSRVFHKVSGCSPLEFRKTKN